MKLTSLFIAVLGLAVTLSAGKPQPSGITYTCPDPTTDGCAVGDIAEFTGTNFPSRVLVTFTNTSTGIPVDNNVLYHASGGNLDIFETLDPRGTYLIEVSDAKGNFIASATVTAD